MPINSEHPYYKARLAQWSRCRDCYEGPDAIKAKGAEYLPPLSGQDQTKYSAYKLRAIFYGATQRTVDGITGAIMRKDPDIKVNPKIEPYLEDITDTGVSIIEFAKRCVTEEFITGRLGILIDRLKNGSRPFFTLYTTEQIINWRYNEDGDLVLVVLKEVTLEPGRDEYEFTEVEQYRELIILEGRYIQRIWKKIKSEGKETFVAEEVTPTQRGQSLQSIPFVLITPEALLDDTPKPPILDLATINISHYQSSADLEHGRHFTALPTPWFSGVTSADLGEGIHIGSGKAIVLPPPEAKAGMLEFTGTGLKELVTALVEKEGMMAKLGARLLEDRRKGIESAETARIHQAGEISIASSIAIAVGSGIKKALDIMSEWERAKTDTEFELNSDFVSESLDPQLLAQLMTAWQTGAISHDTFLWNLKRGELLPPGRSVEDERQMITTDLPTE